MPLVRKCPNCKQMALPHKMGICAECWGKVLRSVKILVWISPEESAGTVWTLVYAERGRITAIMGVIQRHENGVSWEYKYVPTEAKGVEKDREAAMSLLEKMLED